MLGIRGKGKGKGGPRQGLGPNPRCRCPNCGYEIEHEPGIPCTALKCVKCNSEMVGV